MGKQPRRNTSNKTDDLLNNQSKNLDEIQQRRLNHLQAHLNPSATPPQKSPASSKPVVTSATSQQEKVSDDVKKDTIGEMLVMNERYRAHQQPVFEVMRECPSLFTHNTNDLSRADMFDLTFRRMKYLCTEKKLFRAQDCTSNYVAHSARLQAVMTFDESLYLKIALQFNFFAGSLHHLGTPERSFYGSEQFLNQINSLEIMGCFAITELSHGTNVSSIETSAVYDAHSKEFIINSPRKQSMKWWIGNSGHAHMCIVFAQLYIENQCYGVHCFIVPLRTCKYTHPEREPNEILPGITIGDCGPKIGYNGLDNGYIIFDNVRIPDNYMLDKFATITSESGRAIYRSTIESPSKRFGAMLAQLTMGRSGLVGSATHTYALALRTAVPYSFERTQFTLPMSPTKSIEDQLRVNDSEFPLITFQEQKLKLYPLLSEMFAFQFASKHIFNLYIDTMSVMPSDPSKKNKKKNADKSKAAAMQKLHVESSGLKAYCTEQTMNALNTLRASCGGHGYSDSNRFGAWRNAIDVTRTFEGDNTVLLQQVSKHLLSEYQKAYNNHSNFISTGVHYLYDQVNGHLKDTQLAQYTGSVADPWFFTSALESRTKRLTHTAALRYQDAVRKLTEQSSEEYAANIKKLSEHDLKEYQDNHKARNTFLAWNHVQNHLVNASKASVERDIVNYFIEACEQFKKENPEDTENLALLQRLCTLYALTIIQNDLGWFLRHCIADSQAQSIRREITKLCEEFTKEEVYSLLSSLHIPDDILDVPIAMRLDVDSPHATRSNEWTRDYMKNSYQRSLRFQKFGNVEKHNDGDW